MHTVLASSYVLARSWDIGVYVPGLLALVSGPSAMRPNDDRPATVLSPSAFLASLSLPTCWRHRFRVAAAYSARLRLRVRAKLQQDSRSGWTEGAD